MDCRTLIPCARRLASELVSGQHSLAGLQAPRLEGAQSDQRSCHSPALRLSTTSDASGLMQYCNPNLITPALSVQSPLRGQGHFTPCPGFRVFAHSPSRLASPLYFCAPPPTSVCVASCWPAPMLLPPELRSLPAGPRWPRWFGWPLPISTAASLGYLGSKNGPWILIPSHALSPGTALRSSLPMHKIVKKGGINVLANLVIAS